MRSIYETPEDTLRRAHKKWRDLISSGASRWKIRYAYIAMEEAAQQVRAEHRRRLNEKYPEPLRKQALRRMRMRERDDDAEEQYGDTELVTAID